MTKRARDLDVHVEDGALWLTMNRPEVLNAMSAEMSDDIATELEQAVARDDVRVVVLTGVGDAFSTGADISGADAHERFDVSALDMANRIIRAIVNLDKPVVAAVNGVAAGVACSAALAADIIVAKDSASFLLAFARVGLMPDGGATATVAASVGRARAMRMGLLAEPLTAPDAYAAGLVTHVAAEDEYDDLVATIVRRLASGPRWPTPRPRRRSTPPPWATSRPPSNANAPARPCCSAPPMPPRGCAPSPSAAGRCPAASRSNRGLWLLDSGVVVTPTPPQLPIRRATSPDST